MCATYLLTGIQAVGVTPELTTYTLRHADGSELSDTEKRLVYGVNTETRRISQLEVISGR